MKDLTGLISNARLCEMFGVTSPVRMYLIHVYEPDGSISFGYYFRDWKKFVDKLFTLSNNYPDLKLAVYVLIDGEFILIKSKENRHYENF